MPSDVLTVGEDFRALGIFLRGHNPQLVTQRQIDIGLGIASGPWVAVPIPSAAEIAAFFDDPNTVDTGFF